VWFRHAKGRVAPLGAGVGECQHPSVNAGDPAADGGTARAWAPWVVWAIAILALGAALTFTTLNGWGEDDPIFVPFAAAMVLGYSTVGAILASRARGNVIGWLMLGIGVAFALTGVTGEYSNYAFETDPGAVPFGSFAALLSEMLWLPIIAGICLLAALYPTGRVPTPRWRFLPPATVVFIALFVVGYALSPRALEDAGLPATVTNPLGVDALEPLADIIGVIAGIGLLVIAPLSLATLVLRYRRSRGEERQQIRWLAYVAGTIAALIVTSLLLALVVGESFGDSVLGQAFFLATFSMIGIGVPVAMGVAVLRYRLYDLDVVIRKTVLYATVAALLTAVFVVTAVVIGSLAGKSDTAAVVAAAVIGVAFWPALRVARRIADRVVYGRRATPYEILSEFSARVGSAYEADDVLPRMAQILRDAVGASRATVWLRVGSELRPAAVSPTGDAPRAIPLTGDVLPSLAPDTAVEVRDRAELLGALAVSMPANDPMNPSKERLIRDLASQAGLVLRNVRLIEELRASRERIVNAQDARARKLERDIHDGAQQQLVALSVKIRLADSLIDRDSAKAHELLAQLQTETTEALDTLRDLARGIYPPLLQDKGLAAALDAQARRSSVPVRVNPNGIGRYPQEVEATVYFCVLEALNNVAKYASATEVDVELRHDGDELVFAVRDDGMGFDPRTVLRGTGLQGMTDRVDAIGGSLDIRSSPDDGTTVEGRVPVEEGGPSYEGLAAAQADSSRSGPKTALGM
jgi:signal transduction histidine kinase